jgi:hypothetical protein
MRFQGSPIAFVAFFDDTRGMSVAPFIRYEYDTVLLPRGKCSLPQLIQISSPDDKRWGHKTVQPS